MIYRWLLFVSSIAVAIISIYIKFVPYAASIIAVLGTYYWVKGVEEEPDIIKISTGFKRIIRQIGYSDSVVGGSMVGISAALGPFA